MVSRVSSTLSEAGLKAFSLSVATQIKLRRAYDDFYFKQAWRDFLRRRSVRMNQIDLTKHKNLGSDIAVAQFVTKSIGGRVRSNDDLDWNKKVPQYFLRDYRLKDIDASNSRLVTENIDNFVGLDHLETLNLSNNPLLDDFACDMLGRQFRKSKTLRSISLSSNPLITVYGLEVLFRIPSLKFISAFDTLASKFEAIDLFVAAAEDERNCQVWVHNDGRQFKLQELEDLKYQKASMPAEPMFLPKPES